MNVFKIHIDYAGPRGVLDRAVLRGVSHAAVGLGCLPLRDPIAPLPVSIPLAPDPAQGWNAATIGPSYKRFIITGVLRDVAEAASAFLEEIYRVLCIWELFDYEGQQVHVEGTEFLEAWHRKPTRFHKLGLPDKLRWLTEKHGFAIQANLVEHLITINAARNCLVHRQGIVGQPDLTGGCQALIVKWERLHAFVEDVAGSERPLIVPMTVEVGEKVGFRSEPTSREFALGSVVDFDVQELADICMAFMVLGQAVSSELVALGRKRGKIPEVKK